MATAPFLEDLMLMVSLFSLKLTKVTFSIANTTEVDDVVVNGSLVWSSAVVGIVGLRLSQGVMLPLFNVLFLITCYLLPSVLVPSVL